MFLVQNNFLIIFGHKSALPTMSCIVLHSSYIFLPLFSIILIKNWTFLIADQFVQKILKMRIKLVRE